jgi:TatD DNase family protein
MGYSDSHAHMVDYSPEQVRSIVELMRKKKVELVLSVGVNFESSEGTVKLAEKYKTIKAAIGFHPWFAAALPPEIKKRFDELASSKYVLAIGEIGLDYKPPVSGSPPTSSGDKSMQGAPEMKFPVNMPPLPKTPPTHEVQKEVFNFAVSLAKKHGLPVNVHCRGDAHRDMMQIIRQFSGLTGIVHSFEIDLSILRDWLDLGFYITAGMMVVKEPGASIEEIVRAIPIERIVTETDANPMMSPDTGPVDVIEVVQKIAEIKGTPAEVVGNAATANLKRVLKRL